MLTKARAFIRDKDSVATKWKKNPTNWVFVFQNHGKRGVSLGHSIKHKPFISLEREVSSFPFQALVTVYYYCEEILVSNKNNVAFIAKS